MSSHASSMLIEVAKRSHDKVSTESWIIAIPEIPFRLV